jgi:internalin A
MRQRRSKKGRWYVSYAWADEGNPKLEEKVDAFCLTAAGLGVEIFRDKTTLTRGDSISDFMRQIGEGDRVFIFISEKYLHSEYCMIELFEMWRNNRQNKREFLTRVRFFFVDNARISTVTDRLKHTKFWSIKRDEVGQAIDEIGWRIAGEEALKAYWLIDKFVGDVSNVLSLFADGVNPRTLGDFAEGELLKYALGDVRVEPLAMKAQVDREPLQSINLESGALPTI